jgi:hypothetical protein
MRLLRFDFQLAVRLAACALLSLSGMQLAYAQQTTTPQGTQMPSQDNNGPTTRQQQKDQVKTLEQNGYQPGRGGDANYPNNIQNAEKRAQGQKPASSSMNGQ